MAFSDLALNGPTADVVWIDRLNELTADLDVESDRRYDARIDQLQGVFVALARLIADFHEAEPEQSSASEATLASVRSTISGTLGARASN